PRMKTKRGACQWWILTAERIDDPPDMFKGVFEIAVMNKDGITANVSTITVRIHLGAEATFEEIEQALFEEARRHSQKVAQLLADETRESLRQAALDYHDRHDHEADAGIRRP